MNVNMKMSKINYKSYLIGTAAVGRKFFFFAIAAFRVFFKQRL